jgi:hypothetical protein
MARKSKRPRQKIQRGRRERERERDESEIETANGGHEVVDHMKVARQERLYPASGQRLEEPQEDEAEGGLPAACAAYDAHRVPGRRNEAHAAQHARQPRAVLGGDAVKRHAAQAKLRAAAHRDAPRALRLPVERCVAGAAADLQPRAAAAAEAAAAFGRKVGVFRQTVERVELGFAVRAVADRKPKHRNQA